MECATGPSHQNQPIKRVELQHSSREVLRANWKIDLL